MYKIVYPETGEEVVPMRFDTPREATDYWKNTHGPMWRVIKPQDPRDFVGFQTSPWLSGVIVVVRSFDVEGAENV